MDLVLNNLQRLICHKTQQTKPNKEWKQLSGYFKPQISEISHDKIRKWKRKENLKRETESLLIAAQNNTIRNNHIKAKIDNAQKYIKFRFCGDRDETMNHIISKRSKKAQKEYRTRHDRVGKVIHWELCRKLKFDHTSKWYMPKSESFVSNETNKIIWDFLIQTDYSILTSKVDLVKKNPAS